MQQLVITRGSGFIGFLRKISVYVDGNKVGTIENRQTKTFELKPGKHIVYTKVEYDSMFQSNEIEVFLEEGQTVKMYVKIRTLTPIRFKNFYKFLDLKIILETKGVEPLINKK